MHGLYNPHHLCPRTQRTLDGEALPSPMACANQSKFIISRCHAGEVEVPERVGSPGVLVSAPERLSFLRRII